MPASAVGNQVDDFAEGSVRDLIDDALSRGARAIATGAATVLDGVTSEMRLYRDESFGPVVGIIRVQDEEEAIRVANDAQYGLSAAVFTRDVARGLRIARRIRSGICHVNGPTVLRRAANAFRRRRCFGLRQVWMQGRHRRLHRAELDHHRRRARPLSDVEFSEAPVAHVRRRPEASSRQPTSTIRRRLRSCRSWRPGADDIPRAQRRK